MPRTVINAVAIKGPHPGTVAADALDITLTAADVANKNATPLTGREILIAQNSGASPYTVTLTSAPDEKGRTGDITAYSMAAGEFAAFSFLGGVSGWKQADGNLYYEASNAAVKFGVLRV